MVGFCLSKISFGGSASVSLVTPLVKQLWNTSVLQRHVSFVHSIPTSNIATVFNIQRYPFSRGSVRRWLNALQLCTRAWIFDAANLYISRDLFIQPFSGICMPSSSSRETRMDTVQSILKTFLLPKSKEKKRKGGKTIRRTAGAGT